MGYCINSFFTEFK